MKKHARPPARLHGSYLLQPGPLSSLQRLTTERILTFTFPGREKQKKGVCWHEAEQELPSHLAFVSSVSLVFLNLCRKQTHQRY